jgi:hypothetical protein
MMMIIGGREIGLKRKSSFKRTTSVNLSNRSI